MSKLNREQAIARTNANKATRAKRHQLKALLKRNKLAQKERDDFLNDVRKPVRVKRVPVAKGANVRNTSIREALLNAKTVGQPDKVARTCLRSLQGKAGIINEGKGWNASLSFKTFNQLKEQGILIA